jgi:hypothetical protein
MPIRPQMRARYPENWAEISAFIRFERALADGNFMACPSPEDHDG